MTKKLKAVIKRVGAPSKKPGEIKRPDGLTQDMYKRACQEAKIVVQSGTFAELNRQVWEWYFDALDRSRSDSDTSKIFDESIRKETIKQANANL